MPAGSGAGTNWFRVITSIPERNGLNPLHREALLTNFSKFAMLFAKKTGTYNIEAISNAQMSLCVHE
jgi:hypothetical protein